MDYIYSRLDNNLVDINRIEYIKLKTCVVSNEPIEGLSVGDFFLETKILDSKRRIFTDLSAIGSVEGLDEIKRELQREIEDRIAADEQEANRVDSMINQLNENISTIVDQLNQNIAEAINTLNARIDSDESRVDSLIDQVNQNIAAIVDQINQNIATITEQLNANLVAEQTAREEADAAIETKLDSEITRATEADSALSEAIEAETQNRIEADSNITQRLENLEGKTTRLYYGTGTAESPTAKDIQNFIDEQEVVPPYEAPYSGIAVVVYLTDDSTFHIWHYYTNLGTWQDDGIDTVSTFTNSHAGIIQGSTEDGYISAEDGKGKVNGWDSKADVSSLEDYATNEDVQGIYNTVMANFSNYVSLDGDETISGAKTFNAHITAPSAVFDGVIVNVNNSGIGFGNLSNYTGSQNFFVYRSTDSGYYYDFYNFGATTGSSTSRTLLDSVNFTNYLTDYYTTAEIDEKLENFYTADEVDEKLENLQLDIEVQLGDVYTKDDVDNLLQSYATTAYVSSEVSNLQGQIDTANTNISSLSSEVSTISSNLTSLTSEVSTISDDLATAEENITTLSSALDTKQDTLVSGENIKTINGYDVLGSGNLLIEGLSIETSITPDSQHAVTSQAIYEALEGKADADDLNTLSTSVSSLSSSVSSLSTDLSSLSTSVSSISSEVSTLSSSLTDLTGEVSTISSNVSTLSSGLSTLSSEVLTISSAVNTLSENISTISSALDTKADEADLTTLSGEVSTISSSLSSLTSEVSTISSSLETAEGNITEIQSTLSSVETSLATKAEQSDVDTISTTLSSVQTTLSSVESTLAEKLDTTTAESTYATKTELTSAQSTLQSAIDEKLDTATASTTYVPQADFKTNYLDANDVVYESDLSSYYTKTEVDSTLSNYALKTDITAVFKFKGSVETVSALPESGDVGDVYYVHEESTEYVWIGESWEEFGPAIDLSGYATTEQLTSGLAEKVDTSTLSSYYTKTETDSLLGEKADSSDLSAVESEIDTLQTQLADVYTKSEVDEKIADIDLSAYYTSSQVDTLLDSKQDTLTFDTTPTASSTNPVTSGGIQAALSAVQALIDQKQDALVSGTNIKTINGEDLLGEGDVTIAGGEAGAGMYVGLAFTIQVDAAVNSDPQHIGISLVIRPEAQAEPKVGDMFIGVLTGEDDTGWIKHPGDLYVIDEIPESITSDDSGEMKTYDNPVYYGGYYIYYVESTRLQEVADQIDWEDIDPFGMGYLLGGTSITASLLGPQGEQGERGATGATGATPSITMTATSDNEDISIDVEQGGTTAAPTFNLAFTGLSDLATMSEVSSQISTISSTLSSVQTSVEEAEESISALSNNSSFNYYTTSTLLSSISEGAGSITLTYSTGTNTESRPGGILVCLYTSNNDAYTALFNRVSSPSTSVPYFRALIPADSSGNALSRTSTTSPSQLIDLTMYSTSFAPQGTTTMTTYKRVIEIPDNTDAPTYTVSSNSITITFN